MKPIKCSECGAPIYWDGKSVRLECRYCGSVYERSSSSAPKRYISNEGLEFLKGYYPPQFTGFYRKVNEGNSVNISCIEKPVKAYYEMTSNDKEAHILFITGTCYHHIDNTPENRQMQNCSGQDLKRYRSYAGASAFSDIRFSEEHPEAKNVQIIQTEKPKQLLIDNLKRLKEQTMSMNPGCSYSSEFSGKMYSYTENGINQLCLVRLAVDVLERPVYQNPFSSMFGFGSFGGFSGNSMQRDITWNCHNEIYFWGTENGLKKYYDEFEKVYETITFGPDYYRFENIIAQQFMGVQQTISNNQMSMFRAQMDSSSRIGSMINDTYSYGMNLDRQSFYNTQSTMDRINEKRSEAFKGVNSYYNSDGNIVEADVRFDDVYRNSTYSDIYAGTEGSIDMGQDWIKLKKRY